MYTISLPLLGFENYSTLKMNTINEYFSTLILDENSKLQITVVNITYFKNTPFYFNIEDSILEKLNVKKREDFDIYFCVVKQEPIEESIVNLIAPVLINSKEKLLGQYIIKDKVPRLFTTLKPSI